jgi:hypothetical protein
VALQAIRIVPCTAAISAPALQGDHITLSARSGRITFVMRSGEITLTARNGDITFFE